MSIPNISQVRRFTVSAATARFISYLIISSLFIVTACNDDGDDSAPQEHGCRVSKQTSTTQVGGDTPQGYKYIGVITYQYDEKGNKVGEGAQYDYSYNNGEKARSTSTTSSQFDAEGFLIRSVYQSSQTGKDGVTSTSSSNQDYMYENGRLVKESIVGTNGGKAQNYVFQYEYDSEGKLIRTSNTYYNESTVITYSGNIVQNITITDAGGNVVSPFVQYNEKGLLVKGIETYGGGTDEYRFEYTAEGQLAREERYIDSKPSSGVIYEYDTQKNASQYLYTRPKGHPVIPDTRPNVIPVHNIIRETYLQANADASAFRTRGSSLYVYSYNDKGFPTGYTVTTTNSSGVIESSSTVTYEYDNCN